MKFNRTPGGGCGTWPVLAAIPMLVSSVAFAASGNGHREHGAHEHGYGTLDVVVEGEALVIELRVPAVNVVGFEHAPRSDAEREAVRQALERFRDPAAVLVPPPDTECEPERVEADLLSMRHGEQREHDEDHEDHGHGHEKDEHEPEEHGRTHGKGGNGHDEHGHGERHDGGYEEPAADSGSEAHSELHAAYHFHCHAAERLERIQVRVFELLHDVEKIDARVVTPAVQKAVELRPAETVVDLSR